MLFDAHHVRGKRLGLHEGVSGFRGSCKGFRVGSRVYALRCWVRGVGSMIKFSTWLSSAISKSGHLGFQV
jgi:hypothetical protein